MGSGDGVVVRALASHQCGLGLIPRLGDVLLCGLSLLLVLVLTPRGFSSGTPVFPSPQKPTFPNSNSILRAALNIVIILNVLKKEYMCMYEVTPLMEHM